MGVWGRGTLKLNLVEGCVLMCEIQANCCFHHVGVGVYYLRLWLETVGVWARGTLKHNLVEGHVKTSKTQSDLCFDHVGVGYLI